MLPVLRAGLRGGGRRGRGMLISVYRGVSYWIWKTGSSMVAVVVVVEEDMSSQIGGAEWLCCDVIGVQESSGGKASG